MAKLVLKTTQNEINAIAENIITDLDNKIYRQAKRLHHMKHLTTKDKDKIIRNYMIKIHKVIYKRLVHIKL